MTKDLANYTIAYPGIEVDLEQKLRSKDVQFQRSGMAFHLDSCSSNAFQEYVREVICEKEQAKFQDDTGISLPFYSLEDPWRIRKASGKGLHVFAIPEMDRGKYRSHYLLDTDGTIPDFPDIPVLRINSDPKSAMAEGIKRPKVRKILSIFPDRLPELTDILQNGNSRLSYPCHVVVGVLNYRPEGWGYTIKRNYRNAYLSRHLVSFYEFMDGEERFAGLDLI